MHSLENDVDEECNQMSNSLRLNSKNMIKHKEESGRIRAPQMMLHAHVCLHHQESVALSCLFPWRSHQHKEFRVDTMGFG